MDPVPDFFQAEDQAARVDQIRWLQQELDLTDDFFARVFGVESSVVDDWRSGCERPDEDLQKKLAQLWCMFLHLFSLLNFDYSRVRGLLDAQSLPEPGSATASLPWEGSSIRRYLEVNGANGIDEVNRWVTSFRFTDRYSTAHREGKWASLTAQP